MKVGEMIHNLMQSILLCLHTYLLFSADLSLARAICSSQRSSWFLSISSWSDFWRYLKGTGWNLTTDIWIIPLCYSFTTVWVLQWVTFPSQIVTSHVMSPYLPNCWSHICVRLAAGSSLMSVRLGDREPGIVGLADSESSLSELDLLQGQSHIQSNFKLWLNF